MQNNMYYVEVWTNGLFQRVLGFHEASSAQRYADIFKEIRNIPIVVIQYNTVKEDKS